MDSHNFLRSRRSIRRFKPVQVETSVLTRILETATHAPSAHNRQPWRFAVITNQHRKVHLSELLAVDFRRDLAGDGLDAVEIEARLERSRSRITASPVVIVLCMDMSEMDIYTDPAGNRALAERAMAVQSVAAAGLQLQLAAHAEGLASVWTCSPLFTPQTVKTALDLPETWEPQAMFFLGYAAEMPKAKPLKALAEVVKFF
jgi:F420 biosynthesis protein FbiB-like protein